MRPRECAGFADALVGPGEADCARFVRSLSRPHRLRLAVGIRARSRLKRSAHPASLTRPSKVRGGFIGRHGQLT